MTAVRGVLRDFAALRRLALPPFRRLFGRGIVAVSLAVLEGLAIALVIPVAALADPAGGGRLGDVARWTTDRLAEIGLPTGPLVPLGVLAVLAAAMAFVRHRHTVALAAEAAGYAAALRGRVHDLLLRLPWAAGMRLSHARVRQALVEDADAVGATVGVVVGGFGQCAMGVAGALVAFAVDPGLAVLALLAAIGVTIIARRGSGRTTREALALMRERERLQEAIDADLGGGRTLFVHGDRDARSAAFRSLVDRAARLEVAHRATFSRRRALFAGATAVALAVGVLLAIEVFAVGIGTVIVLGVVGARIISHATALHHAALDWEQHRSSVHRLAAFVGRLEREGAPRVEAVRVAPSRRLELQGVTVRHGRGRRGGGIDACSATFDAGTITAVVGPSGAGKTTLLDLVAGLLDPDTGSVLVDGEPRPRTADGAFPADVGYVSQDPWIAGHTVREHLAAAAPDADPAAVDAALTAAHVDRLIRERPGGLDAATGHAGGRFSGGERRRLALAAALLRRPPLLVLDEVTAGLDADTETRVLGALRRLPWRPTIVLSTHRPSATASADVVVHLTAGRRVEAPAAAAAAATEAGEVR